MATKEFIFQGFTARTHADAVRELFDVPNIKRVMLSVAFVSESGVQQIEAQLKANAARVSVFAGIRNEITSYQGLVRLHRIGCQLYTVDTGSRTVVFHPKLFLVRGGKRARLVVGSANLTLGGLNNNIEAGMLLDFDLADAADKKVVDEIEAQLLALPKDHPKHVVKVGVVSILDGMLASGRLIDETAISPLRITRVMEAGSTNDGIPRIKLKVKPLSSKVRRAKHAVVKKPSIGLSGSKSKSPIVATLVNSPELVWESKPLSRRSLDIPIGAKSNPTGSTTLGKGTFSWIDPVTYFRNVVFGHLAWSSYINRQKHLGEIAEADFDLSIKGVLVGTFRLTLRHSLTRTKAAKDDKNVPTELGWNDAKAYIRREDLLGRTMRIFKSMVDPKKFLIEID